MEKHRASWSSIVFSIGVLSIVIGPLLVCPLLVVYLTTDLSPGIAFLPLGLGLALLFLADRLSSRLQERELMVQTLSDTREYVFIARGFAERLDHDTFPDEDDNRDPAVYFAEGIPFLRSRRSDDLLRELAMILDGFCVMTVGRRRPGPTDSCVVLRCGRGWRRCVSSLAEGARAVILFPGGGGGVLWEWRLFEHLDVRARVILIMPPNYGGDRPGRWERVRQQFEKNTGSHLPEYDPCGAIFSLSPTGQLVHQGPYSDSTIVRLIRAMPTGHRNASGVVRELREQRLVR